MGNGAREETELANIRRENKGARGEREGVRPRGTYAVSTDHRAGGGGGGRKVLQPWAQAGEMVWARQSTLQKHRGTQLWEQFCRPYSGV